MMLMSSLLCNSVFSLHSRPTMNHSRWQLSKYVLHKMIWHTGIITLLPWASDPTSANPKEARGTCVGKGFSLSSLLTVAGRKTQKWAWDMKLSRRYGALERLSQCIQALAGTVVLRGCCSEHWNTSPSPLLFELCIPRYYGIFILDKYVTYNLHPVPVQAIVKQKARV